MESTPYMIQHMRIEPVLKMHNTPRNFYHRKYDNRSLLTRSDRNFQRPRPYN